MDNFPTSSPLSPTQLANGQESSTAKLVRTPLWQALPELLHYEERIKLSYERAKSIVQYYRLTTEDVLHLSERYWRFNSDPILALDGSAGTLLTIHYNLCLGTIVRCLKNRPDLQPIVDKLLSFEWNGQYCLTELGHGLDVINMETRATLLPDGSFELHTPNDLAAKYMPPTSPSGYPCIAVVHARLFVSGKDRGPKVFLVQLHDGRNMNSGVVSKVLAPRGSARPVKHCLTYFNHVHLPASALLNDLGKSEVSRETFFDNIYRVITGTISMGALAVSSMRIASYVAARYSLRRHVIDASTKLPRPIMSFSTQYTPILSAIAQSLVFRVFADYCHSIFVNAEDPTMKHFIAAVMKTTTIKANYATTIELGDRCGAQGLAEVNQMSVLHADGRGAAIAEGDILVISIRFAMDLLRQRIAVPPYLHPSSLLARYERSLITSLRASLADAVSYRDQSIDTAVLPLCQPLIEAIGARLAYEAASGSIDEDVLDLFVASTIRKDAAWYALNEGLDTGTQARMEAEAARKLLPRLDMLLDMLEVEPYVVAPIVSDAKWNRYVDSLDTYGESLTVMSSTAVGGE
ncbi:acyl-CoA dehydrogenase NM domain-like protein [Macrolepiota fuliginosa MF-IS2]|uniref:Acyl-CoA dehydrogenase NM domain-like protein n=1 Tax=Macrolepiota fuliginosa MF-IS2 TaxID=1400762 RepID=A0A9P5X4M3_9AGAR|nr:acyl-CoA dehydrogenase NM domain-like protein [Macrolepiota fuliginosa MF-IS2]